MRCFLGLFLLLGTSAIAYAQGRAVATEVFPDGLTVRITPKAYRPDTVRVAGGPAIFFPETEHRHVPAGIIALPVESFLVAAPPGAIVSLESIAAGERRHTQARLAPAPSITFTQDSLKDLVREFPSGGAFEEAIIHDEVATIAGEILWRGVRAIRIDIRPFRYDRETGILTEHASIDILVRFAGASPVTLNPGDDPLFDGLLPEVVVNPEQAKRWRVGRPGSSPADSTGEWFDPAKTYMRIAVAHDGLYALPFPTVSAVFGRSGPFPLHSIALYHKGFRQAALLTGPADGSVDANDSLVFFGSRLRDPHGGPDAYSDTSAFWLLLDADSSGTLPIDSTLVPPDDSLQSLVNTIRLERDSVYFYGNGGLPANNSTGPVAGEGWYWRRLFAGQSTSFPFNVAHPETSSALVQLSGRFHSPIQGQATPTHSIEMRVNGTLAGTVTFNQNRDTIFTISFAQSLIRQGANSLALTSVPTAASINEIYVDWLSIQVRERLTAISDSLRFLPDQSLSGSMVLNSIGGFSSPDVIGVRLSAEGRMEKMIRGSVSGSGPFTFNFTDTVLSGRSYLVAARHRLMSVPSVMAKNFVDLRSHVTGADYLIITAREFSSPSNALASYRGQQGIGRTAVVFVDDIYDEFNFGHESPIPLRSFLTAASASWPDPDPAYIVLFGDANWDPKHNIPSARRNIVPSFGNPLSDAWFAASSSDGLMPERFVGRLPVQTIQQANKLVSDIMSAEAAPLSLWNKTFLFMSAGYTASEAVRFQTFSDNLISMYTEAKPVSGRSSRIYRPPSNIIEFDVTDSIRALIDRGAVWMNFYGHAGTEIWANGISQPDQLANNSGKRHLISDISCSTARFGEPSIEAFGERMLLGDAGGAIGYMGSSGFGYESPLRIIADEMYRAVAQDTLRELGQMVFVAKMRLWQSGTGLLNRQALEQFTLLGDPATRLGLATRPDYSVEELSAFTIPEQPSEQDSIAVLIPIENVGLHGTDTVEVAFNHTFRSAQNPLPSIVMAPVGLADTLILRSDLLQRPGHHSIRISLDQAMVQNEVSRANNNADVSIFVQSRQLLPLWPLRFSSHHADSVVLIVQNPNQPQASQWNAWFEVDQTPDFSGSAVVRSPGIPQGIYSSQWSIPFGVLGDSVFYYWRGRLSSGSDSTNWVGGAFWTNPLRRVPWFQEGSVLGSQNEREGVVVQGGARLISVLRGIAVHSAGFSDGDSAAMYVDGQNISLGLTERGYNVAVLDPANGGVEQFAAFRTYSDTPDTTRVESLIQFLTAIPAGRTVLIAIADEGAVNKTERLNKAIESVGSGLIRSLGFRSSWAIRGRKGAPIGSVPEAIRAAGGGPATVTDTVLFSAIQGRVTSEFVGPAHRWGDVVLNADTSVPGTRINFRMIRKFESGATDTVGLPPGTSPLGPLADPAVRQLKLDATLFSDSAGHSPVLQDWSLSFDPAPELGTNYQAVRATPDSVLEGIPTTVTADVHNSSPVSAFGVRVRISSSGLVADSADIDIPAFGKSAASFILNTAGLRGVRSYSVEIDPEHSVAEVYEENNSFVLPIHVFGDTTAPMFDITFDGARVHDNDYVRPEPEIRISIRDNSSLPISDPGSVVLRIDNRRVTLGATPDSLFETLAGGSERARVTYRPVLGKGSHLLSVQVTDASGNPADTAAYEVRFNVESDLRLLHVRNFPNPFAGETAFTFHVTGQTAPEEVVLRIFTPSGRLIYEQVFSPGQVNIGFNSIRWDGRDHNGDPVANGIYFYKVSALSQGKRVEVIEKLARMR